MGVGADGDGSSFDDRYAVEAEVGPELCASCTDRSGGSIGEFVAERGKRSVSLTIL